MAHIHMSTVNPETIRRHLANNSPAKAAFQFPKSKRFVEPTPQYIGYNFSCPIAFYSNTSELSKRKTSLGMGNKTDFTKDLTASPPSTLYSFKSVFEENKNRGKSFGLSRDRSPDTSYLIPQIQKFPGPGQYENQKETRMNTSYTMRARTIDVFESQKTSKKAPGPGQYESIQMEPTSGRFMCSKFTDSKFGKITNLVPRFPIAKESPGPSSYQEGDSLSPAAKYVLSQHTSRGCRAFNQTARKHFTEQFSGNKKINPGPGTYEKPSQFGIYGDAKFYKTLQGFNNKQTLQ